MPRREFFYSLILVVGFFILVNCVRAEDCATSSGWSSLKINEFYVFDNDWVELYNPTGVCVALSGLKLWDSSESSAMRVLSSTISGNSFWWTAVNNRLGAVSDTVRLKNGDETLDSVIYGDDILPAPVENQSLIRNPDGGDAWILTASATPGSVNFFQSIGGVPTTTPTSTPTTTPSEDTSTIWATLRLNEIVNDPSDGNEWAEFYNPTTSSLDLEGGFLCDNRGTTSTVDCKDLSGTIDADSFLVFDWSGYFFNNDFDSIILKNPSGEILDQVNYGDGILEAPEKGQSLARAVSGAGAWTITTAITPGAENNIVAPIVENVGGGNSGSGSESSDSKEIIKTNTTTIVKSTVSSAKKENYIVWKIKYPTKILVGDKIEFDATGTLDARGGRLDFLWSLGEGVATGTKTQFVFVSSGAHSVTVFVTSTAGTVSSKQFKIMVYTTSTVIAPVVINAIFPNETGADDEEYIKIKNLATSSVDISRWKLFYQDDSYIFPASTTIFGNDELIFYKAITKFSLNNSGGEIELRDVNDFLVDIFRYGKTVVGKEIISRIEDNFSSSSIILVATTTINTASTTKTVRPSVFGQTLSVAREVIDNAWVKVAGIVAVLPGVFGSQYFYIVDETGGLQIYQYKKDFPTLQVGDKITVQGTLSTALGERRLKMKDKYAVDILSTNNSVPEQEADLSELDETQLGGLIKIQGEITEIKSNFIYVDDGAGEVQVYFKQGAGINKSLFKEGENVSIVGILANTKTGLQIWPRSQNDLTSLGPSDDLLKAQAALLTAQNNSKQTAEKYLTATAGGFSALILAFFARARGAILVGGAKKIASVIGKFLGRG